MHHDYYLCLLGLYICHQKETYWSIAVKLINITSLVSRQSRLAEA